MADQSNSSKIAYLAGGCFWCIEAIYQRVKGVISVSSGFASSKGSGVEPAETVKIQYDPALISYEEIVQIFFYSHDPTTVNRQGNDIGPQYRSAIFVTDSSEKEVALKVKEDIDREMVYKDRIVTQIVELENFRVAENYHQNFYNKNPDQPYCKVVIAPKLAKFRQKYAEVQKD